MKKMVPFFLVLAFLLYLTACSADETDSSKSTIGNSITSSTLDNTIASTSDNTATPDNTASSTSDNTIETPAVDNDATIKSELIAKVGLPFRLRKTEGMSLWCITIWENCAERDYSNSMEGQFLQKSLSWKIENGELVIEGDWEEIFVLDLEKMEAISKTDGKVYRIVAGDS
jgi:hypothetical protein